MPRRWWFPLAILWLILPVAGLAAQPQATPTQQAPRLDDYGDPLPEHALLRDQKRVEYTYATDDKALEAFMKLARLEGIIPALESAHAVAEAIQRAPGLSSDTLMIVNLSGRGDKDVSQVAAKVGLEMPT